MQHTRGLLWAVGLAALVSVTVASPAQAFSLSLPQYLKDAFSFLSKTQAQEGGDLKPEMDMGNPMPGDTNPGGEGLGNPNPAPGPGNPGPNGPPPKKFNDNPPGLPPQDGGEREGFDRNPADDALRNINRGGGELNRKLDRFGRFIDNRERKGGPIDTDTREKFGRSKEAAKQMEEADSSDDVEGVDAGQLEDDVKSLEQKKKQLEQEERQLKNRKKQLEQMLKMVTGFEKQLVRLTKQKLAIPASITEAIANIKTTVDKAKGATTLEGVDELSADVPELMSALNESRADLEMAGRFPQLRTQMKSEVKRWENELKRATTLAKSLIAKKIDVSEALATLTAGIAKLKETQAAVLAKAAEGSYQEAFELAEEDFFGDREDLAQAITVIQMMKNLKGFRGQYNSAVQFIDRRIKLADRKKLDTNQVKELFASAKAKGQEVLGLIGSTELDTDAVQALLAELEDLKGELEDELRELLGEEETYSWRQGKAPVQFGSLEVPAGFGGGQGERGNSGPGGGGPGSTGPGGPGFGQGSEGGF